MYIQRPSRGAAYLRFQSQLILAFSYFFRVSKFVRDSFTRTFVSSTKLVFRILLFNFQRPCAARPFRVSSLTIILCPLRFVKNFFHFFVTFFLDPSGPPPRRPVASARAHLLYVRDGGMSTFFGVFSGFFSPCPASPGHAGAERGPATPGGALFCAGTGRFLTRGRDAFLGAGAGLLACL